MKITQKRGGLRVCIILEAEILRTSQILKSEKFDETIMKKEKTNNNKKLGHQKKFISL